MMTSLTIDRVGPESNDVLVNLFEHYLHDMAEWFKFDVGNDGRYGYDMSPHWESQDPIYLARVNGALAGFAIVGSAERWMHNPGARDVREFFVMRPHRRAGVGETLAHHIWTEHRGAWLLRVLEANIPAVLFWREVVGGYTRGHYSEETVIPDGRRRVFFSFDNTST